MNASQNERRAVGLFVAMILAGIGLLAIPWFLTPPAYLDLALRDAVFASDLSKHRVTVTDDQTGKTMSAAVQRIGGGFVARLGRINSGSGVYTARIDGYKPGTARVQAAALQQVRVPVDLTPAFGRLELSIVDATSTGNPVAATVNEGSRGVTSEPQRTLTLDLPPGTHRFSATAAGFCESNREFEIREGKVTKAALPMSPDLKDDEIARFVLGWRNEPRDLDTHFRKMDAVGFPHPAHVFFGHKIGVLPNNVSFARLDVDELYPGAYETLTVRNSAVGDFVYFVHAYQGTGMIGDAGATVQVYTRGCQVKTFSPPSNCGFRVWTVANLHYGNGRVETTDVQQCGPEGTTVIEKPAQ
ncbi:MAG: hypothetical protein DMF56_19410 [Acidobacteria bacterium]|nr:MAG: hypothetical protein DMF56_19410 [Acidobacteriota bacterium]